jgi:hypothetical protein
MHPYSSRAFEKYQEHGNDMKHHGLGNLILIKQNKTKYLASSINFINFETNLHWLHY